MRQINRSRSESHSGAQGKRLKTEFELVWGVGGQEQQRRVPLIVCEQWELEG